MHQAHHQIPTSDGGSATSDASPEELIEAIRAEVDRLSELDPAEVVEPAKAVAEMLGRLLEEVEH